METVTGTLPSKIGIIGDVHTEADALDAALKFLKGQGLETILCTGDIVDGKGSADRCVELLEQFGVITIQGNHDRWLLENYMRDEPDATKPEDISQSSRAFLEGLPVTREFETQRGLLLFCHGIGRSDTARLLPEDSDYSTAQNAELQALLAMGRYRLMLGGHTHHRMVRAFDGLTVINAGTLKEDNEPCFLTVDFEEGVAQFFVFDHQMRISKTEKQMPI